MQFDRKYLAKLLIPLIIEQVLAVTIGMADTVMIASCGEAAVSGISLVDSINILLINIFSALATGGAVVVSQYIGSRDNRAACRAAKQLVLFSGIVAAALGAVALITNRHLLGLVFGHIETEVMDNAVIYFTLSAISYPFLAIYNAGAALFRSMGNSKVPMYVSGLMNIINVGLNAVTIYGLHMGTAGAGTATLIARVTGAVIVFVLLLKPEFEVHFIEIKNWKPEFGIIKSIMRIGVPNGFENGLFQLGKILVQSLVATFGTAAITANAVAGSIAGLDIIPGSAIGLALVTVVGQCIGAGDKKAAKKYTKILTGLAIGSMAVVSIIMIFAIPLIVKIYNLSPETSALTEQVIIAHNLMCIFFWPIAFTLPNALRAAGDAKFTMTVSIITVWTCRIGLSYLFAYAFDMGLMGVWVAMFCDWIVRGAAFIIRFCGKKWLEKRVI